MMAKCTYAAVDIRSLVEFFRNAPDVSLEKFSGMELVASLCRLLETRPDVDIEQVAKKLFARGWPQLSSLSAAVPKFIPCLIGDRHKPKHGWNLDQNADNGCQRCARLKAEKADSDGDGQFKEVGATNQCSRGGDVVRDTCPAHPNIGKQKHEYALQ